LNRDKVYITQHLRYISFFIIFFSCVQTTGAQPISDSIKAALHHHRQFDVNNEEDLIDIAHKFVNKEAQKRSDSEGRQSSTLRLSAVPAAGYSLQTGFAVLAVANAAFYTSKHQEANISSILTSLTYSQQKQIIFPVQANIFTKGNKYNIVVDWRYLKYPSYTYGLGGYTSFLDQYTIDYSALRLHQNVYRLISKDLYLGLGYYIDYFWNIKEVDPPAGKITDFQAYDTNGPAKTELASGLTINMLYDSRRNSINPENGTYLNLTYRPNLTLLGNNNTWRSFVVDARKYFKLPFGIDNILAFWNYDWLTLSGNPPYLMLPNTGGDPYSNTGRGYIQGRFRGKNMLYLEGEYRFAISGNDLLGGVLFVNAQSFTEQGNNQFQVISPGYGAGLRIKLNKFSRTNIAIDYALGNNGSGGFFVNLGEVF